MANQSKSKRKSNLGQLIVPLAALLALVLFNLIRDPGFFSVELSANNNGDPVLKGNLISILNGIGRVFFGSLFDKKGYKPTMIVDMIIFLVATGILIAALRTGNFALIVLGFVVGGFAYGGVTPTNSALISDFFGRQNFSLNFSIINTNLLIASFASTIAGKLYDASQSYMSTLLMMGILTIVAFGVFLTIRRPKS